MNFIHTLGGFYKIVNANTPESIASTDQKSAFNKLWIYPCSVSPGSNGLLTANGAAINIGEKTSGAVVTPDVLNPGDLPLKIELPPGKVKLLRDVFVQGAAGDGVWFKFWTD